MKTLFRVITICLLAVSFFSCERDPIELADHDLVPVYRVKNLTGNNAPFQITVYRNMPMMAIWSDQTFLKMHDTNGYNEATSEDEISDIITLTVEKSEEVEKETTDPDSGETTTQIVTEVTSTLYTFEANKETGVGTLTVATTKPDESVATVSYSMVMTQEEIYY